MPEHFIITPGLRLAFVKFVALVETSIENPNKIRKPILITGPSGVGKSLFAKIFMGVVNHKQIKKKESIRVNCASFDGDLVRSELFGHDKGAFTGAGDKKDGLLKKAEGKILILEEIGEIPKAVQAKLLVFLETGEFYPVGSTSMVKVKDITIVGTTNKDKEDFREDFWFRCIPFQVPPICQRRIDVLYYLKLLHPDLYSELEPWETLRLLAYNWPGNVRELQDEVLTALSYRKIIAKINEGESVKGAVDNEYSTNKQLGNLFYSGIMEYSSTRLDWGIGYKIYKRLEECVTKKNFKKINNLLNCHNLSLSAFAGSPMPIKKNKKSFPSYLLKTKEEIFLSFIDIKAIFDKYKFEGVQYIEKKDSHLSIIGDGFKEFCDIFSLNPNLDDDLFEGIVNGQLDEVNIGISLFGNGPLDECKVEIKNHFQMKTVESAEENFHRQVPKLLESLISNTDQLLDSLGDEKAKITIALNQANWVKTTAAKALGMTPKTLNKKMKEYSIPPTPSKE
ncbi:MAG: sigma 54-interacting transcriptional regulator [Alphaproteobacteria bacterium]|jgi:DNA-binding NtrC family response regulator|nr:sigma 54-interacting transcriptional regulator [Alphaproteobacteria bacterium]